MLNLLFFLLTTLSFASENNFKFQEGHWLSSFGIEGTKYELPFSFQGDQKKIRPNDYELWGLRLGFGKEIYIGNGIFTTIKGEAYYLGSLFSGAKDLDETIVSKEDAFSKRTGQLMGLEISQSIGKMFEYTFFNPLSQVKDRYTFEPYVDGGLGLAQAVNKLNYHYYKDGGTYEDYKLLVSDRLINARIGLGLNITNSKGYYFFLKCTQNRYDITSRKLRGFQRNPDGSTGSLNGSDDSAKLDIITMISFGGGYKF